ncbi:hypothetical protein HZY97_00445 [Sphingomonas sp. R-74633]|uniref:hypothetical protein n=1 Tax=Sphingomonas sp. R-74633 TaxID=2751188 RepID=UPI0015D320C9|nr:hypothetical protein [Sphingomonas sp. R-74633]NYT39212.1 hypothetical protein [Sphingomonas sp. R-74633]
MAALTVALSAWAGLFSAVEYLRYHNPPRALALNANDAGALVRNMDNQIQRVGQVPSANALADVAHRALRSAPLSAGAVRLLAISEQLRGKAASSEQLLYLSSRLSRRDLGTQLALIEMMVQNNDIPKALEHYNIALTTAKDAEGILFPILAEAIEDPVVGNAFISQVRAGHSWIGAFLSYAIRAGGHSQTVARILAASGAAPRIDPNENIKSLLLVGLGAERHFDTLRQTFLGMRGAKAELLTAAGFNPDSTKPTWAPVSWQLTGAAPLSVGFQRREASGETTDLHVLLDSGAQLIAARKLLFLRPGTYHLRSNLQSQSWPAGADGRWALKCALSAAEPTIWMGTFGSGGTMQTPTAIQVSSQCGVQYLDLIVTSPEGQSPLEFVISSPDLRAG